jgi:hypothetical protein
LPTPSSAACAETSPIGARLAVAAFALLGLTSALTPSTMAQAICTRQGDRLHCSDGRDYRIYPEPWSGIPKLQIDITQTDRDIGGS